MSNNATNVVNIPDIQDKVYQKLSEYGWSEPFKYFIKGDEYRTILTTLAKEVAEGKRFTPRIAESLNAFRYCNYDDLKVVIIGQDPYPQLGVADGLAFSCSVKGRPEASLRYILRAIDHTVYKKEHDTFSEHHNRCDLRTWAKQGVLLLNSALSTQIGKPGSHQEMWKPFVATLIDHLNRTKPGLIYILFGKKAHEWEDVIENTASVLKASHPASAAYNKQKEWDCNDVFNKANVILGNQELPEITW